MSLFIKLLALCSAVGGFLYVAAVAFIGTKLLTQKEWKFVPEFFRALSRWVIQHSQEDGAFSRLRFGGWLLIGLLLIPVFGIFALAAGAVALLHWFLSSAPAKSSTSPWQQPPELVIRHALFIITHELATKYGEKFPVLDCIEETDILIQQVSYRNAPMFQASLNKASLTATSLSVQESQNLMRLYNARIRNRLQNGSIPGVTASSWGNGYPLFSVVEIAEHAVYFDFFIAYSEEGFSGWEQSRKNQGTPPPPADTGDWDY